MVVTKEKFEALVEEMKKEGVLEEDLLEKFITGGGAGGQKINKTHNCVYLKHLPTGLEVKCQQDRSREMNRFYARRILLDKIRTQVLKVETAQKKAQAKIRKQKQRRSRKTKEKLLEAKRERGATKRQRQSPSPEE
jgi:protein subunit release factor B